MSPDPNKTCNSLLQNIRDSGLKFICQETPWSMYLTLRKSFVKSRPNQISHSPVIVNPMKKNISNETELNLIKTCLDKLADNHKKFEAENKAVKKDLEEAVEDSDAKNETIQNLRKANSNLHEKIDNLEEVNHSLTVGKKKLDDKELKTLKHVLKELLSKFENSRLEVKNLKSEIASFKSDKNSLSVACKTSRKEITELSKKNDKEKELLKIKIVDLNTFKQEAKAKERAEIRQNRKAIKKSKKEAKVVVIDSLEHDTTADENENITVDVVTNNRFQTLADTNDDEENQAQDHPEPRLEGESSDQKNSMSGASFFAPRPSTAVTTFTVTSSSVTSSSVTSSSSTFQERIQCDQCLRKCVDERDMEHHIYLWHTDKETQILMAKKKYSTSDSKLVV